MKTFRKILLLILIISMIGNFVVIFECFYPLGNVMHSLLGIFGDVIGNICAIITLLGDAVWVSLIVMGLLESKLVDED